MWTFDSSRDLSRVTGEFARIRQVRNFYPRARDTNKKTLRDWTLRTRVDTEPVTLARDLPLENVRSIKLSYFEDPLIHPDNGIRDRHDTVNTRMRVYSHVCICARAHVCMCIGSSNLDPNIRLTFCDGDCISLLFHTSPFLGETVSLSTSRETHFLGYPGGTRYKRGQLK